MNIYLLNNDLPSTKQLNSLHSLSPISLAVEIQADCTCTYIDFEKQAKFEMPFGECNCENKKNFIYRLSIGM